MSTSLRRFTVRPLRLRRPRACGAHRYRGASRAGSRRDAARRRRSANRGGRIAHGPPRRLCPERRRVPADVPSRDPAERSIPRREGAVPCNGQRRGDGAGSSREGRRGVFDRPLEPRLIPAGVSNDPSSSGPAGPSSMVTAGGGSHSSTGRERSVFSRASRPLRDAAPLASRPATRPDPHIPRSRAATPPSWPSSTTSGQTTPSAAFTGRQPGMVELAPAVARQA